MSDLPILSIILLAPFAAFITTVLAPADREGLIKGVNALAAAITVGLSLWLWLRLFNPTVPLMLFPSRPLSAFASVHGSRVGVSVGLT